MSVDTSNPADSSVPEAEHGAAWTEPNVPWESLRKKMLCCAEQHGAESIFGKSAKRGTVYRWGIAAATQGGCSELTEVLSRLACDRSPGRKRTSTLDLTASAEALVDRINRASLLAPIEATEAVLWAAALPRLSESLESTTWCTLVRSLQQLREAILQRCNAFEPTHLILGGELGLTLCWRLKDLTTFTGMSGSAVDAVKQWCSSDDESVTSAVARGVNARLVLASLIRSRCLLRSTTKETLSKNHMATGHALATWVAAMTTNTGSAALSAAGRKDVVDDLPPRGLLGQAHQFDPDSLRPAIAAALGKTQTGGRLAWEICLPKAIHHDPNAKIAVMFADWDVRRGRTHLDYSREDLAIEIFAGRKKVIAGDWQTLIEVNGVEQQACGDWSEVCEFTDDDVHYLEIEQPWSGGILLQRQIMLVRDDRCLLLADAVLPDTDTQDEPEQIKYSSRLPLCPSIAVDPELETREVFLSDSSRRCLVFPLAASEWRVGPTGATLKTSEDHHLLLAAQGRRRLFCPLWLDFQRRRFQRKRTWRQLTIADQLRIVGNNEAVGFRIQVGSEQWAIYRSLAQHRCRSVLGKHLVADFFCSRFDPGDGSHDELITVDDAQSDHA